MRELSLREKIGQLIATGFPAARPTDEWRSLVADYGIGNVILFSHNVESAVQVKELCGELRRTIEAITGCPPLIAIDQEGGRVTRLPADATNVPGAAAIASTGRPEHAYAAGRLTARELRALGINFNLAPVLDINNNKLNPVINVRSYGDTAETVERYGLLMLQGLRDEGVLAAVKHFPGHGDTSVDSHLGLPVVGKTAEQLAGLELKPFAAAIAAGAECVMTAHILFPELEPERVPATMSRAVVTGLLKGRLGFEGLVVSDCLEMDAIRRFYGTAEGAVGALKAGVHLLFISHTPQLVREAAERIERAVLEGDLSLSVVDEAVDKVLYYKSKYGAHGTVLPGARLPGPGLTGSGLESSNMGVPTLERSGLGGSGPADSSSVGSSLDGPRLEGSGLGASSLVGPGFAVPGFAVVGCEAHRRTAEAMSLESVCHLGGVLERVERGAGDTLFIGSDPYRADQAASGVDKAVSFPRAMAEAFAADYWVTRLDPDEDEILQAAERAKSYPRVVVGLVNGREHPGQLTLVSRLRAAGHRVTAVALGKPYDLAGLGPDVCALAAFEYTPLALKSLVRILSGEAAPVGKLSLTL
ncbi:glycoside hydrolase family 3 N-terminal domain-containing protein [Cohnella thermotolerans]|uniref:glycoside hydrolase family 3 N-terminal domain-containing protein n=1 Tax=Cohnella thermotolerans TaxID=329858 RepID=UPI000405897E|nr:glycoside hydrolase family 3 protein [Cohnella thermotolerans]